MSARHANYDGFKYANDPIFHTIFDRTLMRAGEGYNGTLVVTVGS